MEIRGMTLFASAPLNDVYRRTYKTNFTPETLSQLDNATQGGTMVTQQAISQVAANFIAPSAETEGVAAIVHGWNHPRFRFIMEVLETDIGGTQYIAYYIGHTNYMDGATAPLAGNRLAIDPKLVFHVNAVHRMRSQQFIQNGVTQQRMIQDRSSQILYGAGSTAALFGQGGIASYKIRPVDVFKQQQVNSLLESNGFLQGEGVINVSGSMLMGAELSTRRNNTPGTYLYDTLRAYNQALGTREVTGGDEQTMVQEAISLSVDGGSEVYQDPFFTVMRNLEQDIQYKGEFTWGRLLQVAPYLDDITRVFTPEDVVRARQQQTGNNLYTNTWSTHNTSSWQSADVETVAATLLANSVPTIMLENLTASMRFTMTNMTGTGEIAYTIDNHSLISPTVDQVQMVTRIIERIKLELMPLITQNNNLGVRLMVDSSVFGDTAIHIAITSEDFRTYVMPTFADNAASPVLTTSNERHQQVTHDMYQLGYTLFEKRLPTQQTKPQIITQHTANNSAMYI